MQPSLQSPGAILRHFFRDSGMPTAASTARLRSVQQKYEALDNPNAFYLTMNVRDAAFDYVHNTEKHFGEGELTYEHYLNFIHPDLVDLYLQFGSATYQIAKDRPDYLVTSGSTSAIKVPLRRVDGRYYWFIQTAYPMQVDLEGRMVSHFNVYQLIGPYDGYLYDGPLVTIGGEFQPDVTGKIRKDTEGKIIALFFDGMEESKKSVLNAWRDRYREDPRADITSSLVATDLNKSVNTVKSYNRVILEKANTAFPASSFQNMRDLVALLERLFG